MQTQVINAVTAYQNLIDQENSDIWREIDKIVNSFSGWDERVYPAISPGGVRLNHRLFVEIGGVSYGWMFSRPELILCCIGCKQFRKLFTGYDRQCLINIEFDVFETSKY